jgi:hypothetical protein
MTQNALAVELNNLPQMDLVGPTVNDDIRRAIWRYGAEAVKAAVKEETKAKRGRKREPDWLELRDIIEADAQIWLAGDDPFAARSNYSIAKAFAERKPGQSPISTHQRIERKLGRRPHDRRWFTLVSAHEQSRAAGPYGAHLRALEALSQLPDRWDQEVWPFKLERAHATILDFEAREGHPPPDEMTFEAIEAAVKARGLNALISPPRSSGMFGALPFNRGLIVPPASKAGEGAD